MASVARSAKKLFIAQAFKAKRYCIAKVIQRAVDGSSRAVIVDDADAFKDALKKAGTKRAYVCIALATKAG